MFRIFITLLFIPAIIHLPVGAQSKVDAPAPSATFEELHDWFVKNLAKFGSYKTRTTAAKVTGVKIDGCTLRYTASRQNTTTSQSELGVTKRTSTVKDDIVLKLGDVESGGITLEVNIYPELRTIAVTTGKAASRRVTEIAVRSEAAEALADVLERHTAPCRPKP